MTQSPDKSQAVANLVDRFLKIAMAQHQAILLIQNAKYTRLFWQMEEVLEALKSIAGDQRRSLLPLLGSRNLWVRYKTAHAVLALEPALARRAIESVRDSKVDPEAAEASSTLWALDEGIYVPK